MKTLKSLSQNLGSLVRLLKKLERVEKDCHRLNKGGYLTEYGEGQLCVIRMIRESFKY